MKDGGPAYPLRFNKSADVASFKGMSMRQRYKIAALQGPLAMHSAHSKAAIQSIANDSGAIADAMLGEGERQEQA